MRLGNYKFNSTLGCWLIVLLLLALALTHAFWTYQSYNRRLPLIWDELEVEDDFGHTIQNFTKLMRSLDIMAVVIEPKVIHQLLDIQQKSLLWQRQFEISRLKSSKKIINFGFLENNITNLNYKLLSGLSAIKEKYKYWREKRSVKPNDWMKSILPQGSSYACHHFFARNGMLVHAVVFYKRENYFWHCGLESQRFSSEVQFPVTKHDLLFSEESSYESFSAIPAQATGEETVIFHIPKNPAEFLLQIEYSKFLECDLNRSSSLKTEDKKKDKRYKALKAVFVEAITEFKSRLRPRLIRFFIFAGTLLGWYRQCDIIPYTSDVDFAGWATDIGSEEFWILNFENNSHVKLAEQMGMAEEAFELSFRTNGFKVDLFFLYENETLCWAYGHRPSKGYYFSYNYPKFKLCSADLVGQRVLVPCTPEEVIIAEYGSNWREPARSWYYETAPKNMGPRLYWPEEKRAKVSKYFP